MATVPATSAWLAERSVAQRLTALAMPLVLAGYCALAVAYSLATPVLEAPDENGHLGYVNHLVEHRQLPFLATSTGDDSWERFQPPLYYTFLAALLAVFNGRPIDPALEENPDFFLNGGRSIPRYRHPPGEAGSVEINTFRLLRALQIVFGLLTVYFTYRLAILVVGKLLAPVAALAVAGLPQFLYISAVLNNDNLANCLSALAAFLLLKTWVEKNPGLGRAVVIGLILGMGLLAKLSTAFLVPASGVILAASTGDRRKRWTLPTLALGVTGLTSAWFFLWELAVCGNRACVPDLPLTGAQLVLNWNFWKLTLWSFTGYFGWMAFPLDIPIRVALTLLWAAPVFGGTWAIIRGRAPKPAWVVGGLAALAVAQFLFFAWFYGVQAQGRYLFVALPALATLWTLGLSKWLLKESYRLPLLAGALLAVNLDVLLRLLPRLSIP